MQVRRYEAASMHEALTKIKRDLGRDAFILSSKRLKGGNLPRMEVTAAIDKNYYEMDRSRAEETGHSDLDIFASLRSEVDEMKAIMLGVKNGELTELRETLNTFFDTLGPNRKDEYGDCRSRIYYHLISRGISRPRACRLINILKTNFSAEDMTDTANALKVIEEMITKSIRVSHNGTNGKRLIAFVGPTGVGKTTTLAKLAAHFALDKGLNVALLTADNYRIAGTEQLKVYANIMGLPIEVISGKKEFEHALTRFADKDMILVDTPGKSQSDSDYMEELRDFLSLGCPVETNLLLSMTSSIDNMLDTAARFGVINYDNIIFTKLDECVSFGSIFNVVDQVGKPVAYITNGQNVPRDIERANPAKLANLIIGNGCNCSGYLG